MVWEYIIPAAVGLYQGWQNREATARANSRNERLARDRMGMSDEQARKALEYQKWAEGQSNIRYLAERQDMGARVKSKREREDDLNRLYRDRFDVARGSNLARLSPYMNAGESAGQLESNYMGLNGKEAQRAAFERYQESPGQAFLRERMEKTLLRNQAALGGLGGGDARKALMEQAFNIASTNYENNLNRLSQVTNRGLMAGRAQAGMRLNPTYISTGVDTGVSDGGTLSGLYVKSEYPAQAAHAPAPSLPQVPRTPVSFAPPRKVVDPFAHDRDAGNGDSSNVWDSYRGAG